MHGYDTTDLTNKALLAAQQGGSPDVLIVDNPVVCTLADAGVLTTTDDTKLDTSGIEPNFVPGLRPGAGERVAGPAVPRRVSARRQLHRPRARTRPRGPPGGAGRAGGRALAAGHLEPRARQSC